ncbi:indole-3-glycerol phosphate synthase TrpC [Methanosphaerula palustris]|uniref:Indole-3-glycerol phosphate synthase n=1 Tax=Methanosphaerula palustris (strain ATCC BAA-1556 / DSM 19958 / E1-9c) TaxID=521011 RepID=B8GJ29_METPE|nr:indole-3-glycerol-phosphate synthase [Methanosphaerula palustris]ACL15602.1 Indole-3-glycerol-phosphate synthase [Methanosphaerula palustris E1-9c]
MILDHLAAASRVRGAHLPTGGYPPSAHRPVSLAGAIRNASNRHAVIAEIKPASPSMGAIRMIPDPGELGAALAGGGCVGLSVLTEPELFGGSVEALQQVRARTTIPILRKDFITDLRQIAETQAISADAVLLIARLLGDDLPTFVRAALDAGLEPLVEVHTEEEMDSALATSTPLIGINNRDLATLQIDRSVTRRLAHLAAGAGRVVISESGIKTPGNLMELTPFADAFLIGTAVMAAPDPVTALKGFIHAGYQGENDENEKRETRD